MKYNTRSLTAEEENKLYGEQKVKIGTCFKKLNHYYFQREEDVLHINTDGVLSILHVGYLNNEKVTVGGKYRLITEGEFRVIFQQIIYNYGLQSFWGNR